MIMFVFSVLSILLQKEREKVSIQVQWDQKKVFTMYLYHISYQH